MNKEDARRGLLAPLINRSTDMHLITSQATGTHRSPRRPLVMPAPSGSLPKGLSPGELASKRTFLDPYAEIEKVPLQTKDGMRSRGFTVRLEDDTAESGWREVGVVSEDYLLVANRDVQGLAFDITDRAGGVWQTTKEFFDGRRYALALALRSDSLQDVAVGDPVGIGLLFENSYDGSRRLSASVYVNRLVCMNGMIAPKLFRQVRFKHDQSNTGWEGEISRSLDMLRHAPLGLREFAASARALAALRMTTDELSTIRGQVLGKVPVTLWGKIVDRLLLEEDLTGWGLVNAATAVLWHAEKQTASDFGHNEHIVTALLKYVRADYGEAGDDGQASGYGNPNGYEGDGAAAGVSR